MLGMPGSIANIGFAAATIALPQAAHDLGVNTGAATWLVAGYTLGIAGSLPVGRLINARGSRPTLASATVLLAGGSASLLIAPSLALLVVARAIRGLGASMIAVTGFTAIGLRAEDSRTAAFGALTSIGALVAGAGPISAPASRRSRGGEPCWSSHSSPCWRPADSGARRSTPLLAQTRVKMRLSAIAVLIAAASLLAIVEAPATNLAFGYVVGVFVLGAVATAVALVRARSISTPLLPLHVLRNPRDWYGWPSARGPSSQPTSALPFFYRSCFTAASLSRPVPYSCPLQRWLHWPHIGWEPRYRMRHTSW